MKTSADQTAPGASPGTAAPGAARRKPAPTQQSVRPGPRGFAVWQFVYSALFPLLLGLMYVAALRSRKLRQSLAGRRGVWARLAEQAAARDDARPLVWFHVSSAGEFLQAMPVLERLTAAGMQCALTVSSVSGYTWASRRRDRLPGVVVLDYLPFDFRRSMRRLVGLLRPDALVLVKFDVWPNLVWEAARAGVPGYLISGTLHGGSARVRNPLGRSLYGAVYGALSGIYAVSEGDAARFRQTCPAHPDVQVLGDTRFDSVLDRRGRMMPPPVPAAFRGEDPVLVVGSSWPADEERLFPALQQVLAAYPALKVMLVPHEVHEDHLTAIEAAFPGERMARFTALGEDGEPTDGVQPRLLLVDAVGQLAALYTYADLAYVGGAFSTGVHNVMEPAALGLPSVFGPHYGNSPEAEALVAAGHAFPAGSAEECRQALSRLLDEPQARRSAGEAARAYVEGSAGAAQRCFDIIQGSLA